MLTPGDTRRTVMTVLDRMPDTLRQPLILHEINRLSYADIAQHLNISLSATKMRINRARRWFRQNYRSIAT